jgi:hypothetical protein
MKYGYEDPPAEFDQKFEQALARTNCWHDTYNVVLGALYTRNMNSPADMHEIATEAANRAHGQL